MTTKDQSSKLDRELKLIRNSDHDGRLRAEAVVEFARNPKTELHRHFDWDDTSAATAWRLEQARQIIRVRVTLLDTGDGEEMMVRAYVSMAPPQPGYIETADLLASKRGRRDLILKLLERMLAIAESYRLPELRPVVGAIGKMQAALAPRGRRPGAGKGDRPQPSA
jgi:hypothetical protein